MALVWRSVKIDEETYQRIHAIRVKRMKEAGENIPISTVIREVVILGEQHIDDGLATWGPKD